MSNLGDAKGWNRTNIPELPYCMTEGFSFTEDLSTPTFPPKEGNCLLLQTQLSQIPITLKATPWPFFIFIIKCMLLKRNKNMGKEGLFFSASKNGGNLRWETSYGQLGCDNAEFYKGPVVYTLHVFIGTPIEWVLRCPVLNKTNIWPK